jgi:hypothetical protein
MIIEDGQGNGRLAYVTNQGQQVVVAESHSESRHQSAAFGNSFLIKSGFITASATADTTSAIIYIKNISSTKSILFGHLRTCGEAAMKWRAKIGATGLSSSTAVTPSNMNIASSIELDATVEFGAQNATVTGGTEYATWINNTGHSEPDLAGALILGPNDTFTLEAIPFASVAAEVCTTIEVWQIIP